MTVPTRHDPPFHPEHGGVVIRPADGVVTGRWRGLQALGTGATLDAGTAASDLAGTLTGLVIPAGATVWGQFSAIELSAGSCLMYQ